MKKRPTLNELAFFGRSKYFRLLKKIPGACKHDTCRIVQPLLFENNDGFWMKNDCNDDYYLVKIKLDEQDQKYIDKYQFPILLWDEFWDYFEDDENMPSSLDQEIDEKWPYDDD